MRLKDYLLSIRLLATMSTIQNAICFQDLGFDITSRTVRL